MAAGARERSVIVSEALVGRDCAIASLVVPPLVGSSDAPLDNGSATGRVTKLYN